MSGPIFVRLDDADARTLDHLSRATGWHRSAVASALIHAALRAGLEPERKPDPDPEPPSAA